MPTKVIKNNKMEGAGAEPERSDVAKKAGEKAGGEAKSRKRLWIITGVVAAILVVIGVVAIVVLANKPQEAEAEVELPEWSEKYYTYLEKIVTQQKEETPDSTQEYTVSFHELKGASDPLMFIEYDTEMMGRTVTAYGADKHCDIGICAYSFGNYIGLVYDVEREEYAYYAYPSDYEELSSFTIMNVNEYIAEMVETGDFDYEKDPNRDGLTAEEFEARFIPAENTGEASFTYNVKTEPQELKQNVAKTAKEIKTSDELVAYVSQDIQERLNKILERADEPAETETAADGFTLSGTTYPYGKYQYYGPDDAPADDVIMLNADGTGYREYGGVQHPLTFKVGQANMTQSEEANWMTALVMTDLEYGHDSGLVASTVCEYCLVDTGLGYYKFAGN